MNPPQAPERISDRVVLLVIVAGLVAIILSVVLGIFITARPGFILPNWAENVLIAIGTGALLKFGDSLSALIALSTGRQVERLGTHLANTTPVPGAIDDPERPTGAPGDPVHTIEEGK